jgi:hypothetical protein
LIDSAGVISAGHARVLAACEAGLDQVSVMRTRPPHRDSERAYVIADNKLALNVERDLELLWQEVAATEAELRKLNVFSDQEYEELLPELDRETGVADEENAPDVPQTPVTIGSSTVSHVNGNGAPVRQPQPLWRKSTNLPSTKQEKF